MTFDKLSSLVEAADQQAHLMRDEALRAGFTRRVAIACLAPATLPANPPVHPAVGGSTGGRASQQLARDQGHNSCTPLSQSHVDAAAATQTLAQTKLEYEKRCGHIKGCKFKEPVSLFELALARIRTGWRIRHEKNGWIVYGPHGDATGITPEARHALAYYMMRCSMGRQEPITNKLTMDFLPAAQEQADVLDDHLRLVHWSDF